MTIKELLDRLLEALAETGSLKADICIDVDFEDELTEDEGLAIKSVGLPCPGSDYVVICLKKD